MLYASVNRLNAFFYLAADILTKLSGFFAVIFYTHYLIPEAVANYYIYIPIIVVLSLLLSLNMNTYLPRYLFENNSSVNSYFETYTFVLTFSLLLILTVFLLLAIINSDFLYLKILIVALSALAYSFLISLRLFFEASKKGFLSTVVRLCLGVLPHVFNVLIIGFLDFSGQYILLYGYCFSIFLTASIFLFKFRIYISLSGFDKVLFYRVLKYSLPLVPYAVAPFILAMVDKIIIAESLSKEQSGFYSVGFVIGTSPMFIIASLSSAWLPDFFNSFKKKMFDGVISQGKKIIVLVFFICLFMVIFGNIISRNIFPKDYYNALSLIPIFSLATFCFFIYNLNIKLLSFYKRVYLISTMSVVGIVFNVSLNLYWMEKSNFELFAYSFFITYLVLSIISSAASFFSKVSAFNTMLKYSFSLLFCLCFVSIFVIR